LFELNRKRKKAENNKRFGDGEGILTSVCFLNLEEKKIDLDAKPTQNVR
jgi:hypothetical protein